MVPAWVSLEAALVWALAAGGGRRRASVGSGVTGATGHSWMTQFSGTQVAPSPW